ncbi:putative fimbrial protein StaE [Serratia liquefaciens]|nr:putative fimbrial protein StaE [Serratia quinivorans]CAI1090964.1 putative fimbrial protein StaE [Serratia quinivorans]CAI2121383.1 putative fimbrial protein StaE [Serratia quinivorans]CAI2488243.1 putative fimbrial protein StaE [Serratia liquefaciens]
MQKHWQMKVSVVALAVLAIAGVGLTAVNARAASDSVQLTFKYTLLQGTCDVSVGSDGMNGLLAFGDISTANMTAKNWDPLVSVSAAKKPFKVILSNCSGSPLSTTTPVLYLTGNTDTETGNSVNKSFMFRESGSTAKGVGFAIYKNNTSSNASDLVAVVTSGEADARKYIDVGSKGAVAVNKTIDLNAIVTCGSTCSASDKANMRAGDLNASVTFNFDYH